MSLDSFNYLGYTYYYDASRPVAYYYEDSDHSNVIIYKCTNYAGHKFKAEWRIFGTKDLLYTKRMIKKLAPWDVIDVDSRGFWRFEYDTA